MEVRTRSSSNHRGSGWHEGEDEYDKSCVKEKARVDTLWNNSGNCPTLKQKIRRETWEMTRVMTTLVQGRASKLTYLLIPAMISILWVLICLFTTRQPSISIEERLSQQHYRQYFDDDINQKSRISMSHVHKDEESLLPAGKRVEVVIAMPFLDVNPLAANHYLQALEWILIYSTVPITFHVITNEDSVPYVTKVLDKLNETSESDFQKQILTLSEIISRSNNEICPKLGVRSEFCEVVMGNMTPLLFPWLFPKLDHAIYIDRNIVFQSDVGILYNEVDKLKKLKQGFAMANEQTNLYAKSFAGWQKINPSTKLGRPLPDGKPGYNPDMILMDLDKLRASTLYRSYFNEPKLNRLVKNYVYHSKESVPNLGDMVNIMAADSADSLILTLDCSWNRLADKKSNDPLFKKFNVCEPKGPTRIWNGAPDTMGRSNEKKAEDIKLNDR